MCEYQKENKIKIQDSCLIKKANPALKNSALKKLNSLGKYKTHN